MHYFIDGYNLLFRLMRHAQDDLQAGREAIISDLNKKTSLLNLNVSIVFDAPFQFGEGVRTHFDQLEILFTAEGETADEFILEEIKESIEPEKELVITSDKPLALGVRNRKGQTQSVEEFWEWLNRAYKNKCRHRKKEQKEKVEISKLSTPTFTEKKKIPDQNTSLDQCEGYYERVFSDRWKKIAEQENRIKAVPKKNRHPLPRKPKKKEDPFLIAESEESREADEMERWLKIFEKRTKS